MLRLAAVTCALGLWVGPAVAAELRLDQPTMSTRPQRCTDRQRAACESLSRPVDHDLRCDACDTNGPPLPAEIVAPSRGDTPRPARPHRGPDCDPRGTTPGDCPALPPVDALPRP